MREPKIETWIRAGYKLLGTEGLDGIKVEQLARVLRLNKSGFYYYFGSMKVYIKNLLQHHLLLSEVVAAKIRNCKKIDPDLLKVVILHKGFFLVEAQLLVKGKHTCDYEEVEEAGQIISKELLPLWKKETSLPETSEVALPYLNILRHFFYARINPDNLNYEFLHQLADATRDVLNKVAVEKNEKVA